MIKSKLTAKAQTTIPQPVREALRRQPGDDLAYPIEGEKVILTRTDAAPLSHPFTTFTEWHGDADRTGYREL
jgi:antitoxin PrlF